MAAIKTERSVAGHKTAPKRPKDWVAPVRTIVARASTVVTATLAEAVTAVVPQTDEEKKAVSDFDAASKALAKAVPNDRRSEGAYSVAYRRLAQLGLRPALRGRYRP